MSENDHCSHDCCFTEGSTIQVTFVDESSVFIDNGKHRNNSFDRVYLAKEAPVVQLIVTLKGSGAITDMQFGSLVPPIVPSSLAPMGHPSSGPSSRPSTLPSDQPSEGPTTSLSVNPSASPSSDPSVAPNSFPSMDPSMVPTATPSELPEAAPSSGPSAGPSSNPGPTGLLRSGYVIHCLGEELMFCGLTPAEVDRRYLKGRYPLPETDLELPYPECQEDGSRYCWLTEEGITVVGVCDDETRACVCFGIISAPWGAMGVPISVPCG